MKKILFALTVAASFITSAFAQTSPNLTQGQVLTPAQWNQLFINKQDTLGFAPMNPAGAVMTGRLVTPAAPNGTLSGFNMVPGAVPSAPSDGDMWTTVSGLFVRIGGSTLGPLGTLACPTCVVNNATNTFSAYQIINLNATTIPAAQTGTVLQVGQADGVSGRIEQDSFAASSFFSGIRANGTNASPTGLITDDAITSFNGWGYDGTTRAGPAVSVRLFAGGTWSGTSHPSYLDFATTPSGSTVMASRMRVESDGGITVGGAASQGSGTLSLLGSLFNNGVAPTGTGGYVRATAPALVSPTANTLAIGGAAIGGNALAVTGTAAFNSSVTAASNILLGATSGNMTLVCAAVCGSSQITLPSGTTNFSATGGANQVLMQTSAGGALTVAQLGFSGLSGTIAAGQFSTGPGIVTLAMLNNAAAATIVGNATAGSAVRTDILISGLTDITTPHATLDWLLIQNHTTGTLQKTNASELLAGAGAGVTSLNTQSGVVTLLTSPQGRLTLLTGTPVMSTTQSAKAQIFYTCSNGNQVPYYTGSADAMDTIAACEVSLTMVSAATAGQTVNNNVYDVWWVHGGANRVCIAMSASTGGGGGWSSDGGSNTSRGTGYSQLDFLTRPYITNKNSITNCFNGATNYGPVSANQATWVGTTYTTANGQTSYKFGANGTSGQNALFGVYNAYNRVSVSTQVQDTTASWVYTTATFRQANGSTSNQIQYLDGIGNMSVSAEYSVDVTQASGSTGLTGIGINSTTVNSGRVPFIGGTGGDIFTSYRGVSGLGLNTLAPLERGTGAGTNTWFGGTGSEMQFAATIGGL